MRERERVVVGGLTVLMLLLWLGFLIHRSPRFAGSLTGGALGICAALLMLVPLAYLLVKRVGVLRRRVTARVSLRTLLGWHIYAGILGAILALLHTGHRFASPLGITLISLVLVVALSGFAGRYLLRRIGEEERDRRAQRDALRAEYDKVADELRSADAALLAPFATPVRGLLARLLFDREDGASLTSSPALRAVAVADALSDLEYAVRTQELFRLWFSRWLRFHILVSSVLYALLVTHVAVELSLGVRWL